MPRRRHDEVIAEAYAELVAEEAAQEPAERRPTFRVDARAWLKDAKRREMRCPKEREYE